jgi:hypothetical protein
MHYQKFNSMILIEVFLRILLKTNKYVNKKMIFLMFFGTTLIGNNDAVLKGHFNCFFYL